MIVRSGWIYGTGGTNFLSVMHRLLGEGKRIKAIADSYGTPTFALDLADAFANLPSIGRHGRVSRYELRRWNKLSGFRGKSL